MIHILKRILKPGESLTQKAAKGTFWLAVFKVFQRSFGFIQTVIVARLLAPEDFGLFGLACLSLSALDRFTQMGVESALVQKKGDIKGYLDCAWTINVVKSIFLFILLYLFAPLIATFFNNVSAAPLIRVIGLIFLIQGIKNIGMVHFTKDLEFHKVFLMDISQLLVSILVTIPLAFILKNAWALMFGMLVGSSTQLLLSYLMHPHRPKLDFNSSKMKELLHFGKWLLGSSILTFLITEGDDIFVGKVLGLTALGFYQMSYRISNMVATEISNVISRVAYPLYAKLQSDFENLKEAYFEITKIVSFLCFLITGLIIVFAPDFTRIFLGEKWLPMVSSMQVLSIYGLIRATSSVTAPLLKAMGKPAKITQLQFFKLVILLILIIPFTVNWGILGTSIAVVISSFFVRPYLDLLIIKIIKCTVTQYVKLIIVPFFSGIVMMLVVLFLKSFMKEVNIVSFFLLGISAFITYLIVFFFLGLLCKYEFIKTAKRISSIIDN